MNKENLGDIIDILVVLGMGWLLVYAIYSGVKQTDKRLKMECEREKRRTKL